MPLASLLPLGIIMGAIGVCGTLLSVIPYATRGEVRARTHARAQARRGPHTQRRRSEECAASACGRHSRLVALRLSHLLALSAPPQPCALAGSAGPAAMAAMEVMAWLRRRRQQLTSKQQKQPPAELEGAAACGTRMHEHTPKAAAQSTAPTPRESLRC